MERNMYCVTVSYLAMSTDEVRYVISDNPFRAFGIAHALIEGEDVDFNRGAARSLSVQFIAPVDGESDPND